MDRTLYDKISAWFDGHREQLTADIVRLVKFPSISQPQEGDTPFGEACRNCLEEMLAIGREHGFYTENYENYVGSIGEQHKDWDNMIGFWNHLDVVPVGNHWQYDPFSPVQEGHFLIGRGAQDNKGPAVGMLYVMKCLRELEIPLKHQLCLFVGCDEERGMQDLAYYTQHYPVPWLSMIADSGFPVCYGEKGIVEGQLKSIHPVSAFILELQGGNASNMIPDTAHAVLRHTEALELCLQAEAEKFPSVTIEAGKGTLRINSSGESRHSAFPEGSRNAVHELMRFLAAITALPEEDRTLFSKLAYLSEEYYGEHMGIAGADEVSGKTTCAATILELDAGKAVLHLNIRYAITANPEKMLACIGQTAQENEMLWELKRNSAPNYFPKEHPAVKLLTDLYNEITGEQAESFVMGGGTYARKLPRAFAYGIGGMGESEEDLQLRKELFAPGHGGAHEPDEGLNLRLLIQALKIYAMAMVTMNDISLDPF